MYSVGDSHFQNSEQCSRNDTRFVKTANIYIKFAAGNECVSMFQDFQEHGLNGGCVLLPILLIQPIHKMRNKQNCGASHW